MEIHIGEGKLQSGGMFGVNEHICRNITIHTGFRYAQYNNAVVVSFTEKGKRKPKALVFTPGQYVLVVDLKAPTPADPLEQVAGGRASRYPSYDKRYLEEHDQLLASSGAVILWDGRKGA